MENTDLTIIWQWGVVQINATILNTWIVMAVLVIGSALLTRKLSTGARVSRWQNLLEVVVGFLRGEVRQLSDQKSDRYLPFVGTIFLFIATSTILDLVPGFKSPFISISSAAGLAICVFLAVPIFGIAHQGVGGYLKNYIRPSPFMLPFNIIGELSRTLALAVRLFGNVMSGAMIVGILLSIVPFIFPTIMQVVGLFFGMIQAYIFAVLTMVYIASGLRATEHKDKPAISPEVADDEKQTSEQTDMKGTSHA